MRHWISRLSTRPSLRETSSPSIQNGVPGSGSGSRCDEFPLSVLLFALIFFLEPHQLIDVLQYIIMEKLKKMMEGAVGQGLLVGACAGLRKCVVGGTYVEMPVY